MKKSLEKLIEQYQENIDDYKSWEMVSAKYGDFILAEKYKTEANVYKSVIEDLRKLKQTKTIEDEA